MKIEINGQNFDLSQTSKTFLEKYLERMKRFLKDNNIEEDVYDDIEERITEKFMENLSDPKSKEITDKVVIDIVNEIGEPSEILEELIDNDFETKKEQKKKSSSFKEHFESSDNPLTRNSEKGILFGVCYGIADKYNLDPLWIRLAFVFGTLLWGTTIILYIVLIFLLPNDTYSKKKDKGIINEVEEIENNIDYVNDDDNKHERENGNEDEVKVPKKDLKQEEKIKIKNIGLRKVDEEALERKIKYIQQKRGILGKFFILIGKFIKAIIIFIFNVVKYAFAFALIVGTVPVLIGLIFATGAIFTNFQFDNQALFSQVDVFLKIGVVGILASILFLILGIFLKLFKSQNLSNGLMINGILGIFIFAFIGGLGFFTTLNEYKSTYTKTEVFEFDAQDFKIDNLELFGNSESLIEGLNRVEGVNFYESDDDKIKIEVISTINSKSNTDSEQVFSEFTPFEIKLDNGLDLGLNNNSTFKTLVPYSFLRREVKIYIPKNIKIQLLLVDNYYRTNLYHENIEEGDYYGAYGTRNCSAGLIEYVEEVKGFVCE